MDAVGTLGGCRQAENETGFELGKNLPVRIEVKGADRFAAGELTVTK